MLLRRQMDSYIPDECWESVFRFIINDDNNNDFTLNQQRSYERYCNHHRYLNSLSLVSKQFLSITNRLRFSITINKPLKSSHIFRRFTNLTSLNLKGCRNNLNFDELLYKMSRFPLKQLTSLSISDQDTFPANGLRSFSQKITTLTSLTCSNVYSLNLFLVDECFPLLEELELSYPSGCKDYSSYVDGVEALSLALIKLRKVNLSGFPINDQSLFHLFNNCKQLEEVVIFDCDDITSTGLASALRERPTMTSLSFSTTLNMRSSEVFTTSQFIDSLVSLKGLTCLVLHHLNLSNELLYSIAREGLPLTKLDLDSCENYSCVGLYCLLSNRRGIQHLNLDGAYFLEDQHVVKLSLYLRDLVSINLSHCWELTYSALFALVRNCPSLSEFKMEIIGSNIVGNSDSLGKFGVFPQLKALYLGGNLSLTDESIIKFASVFPNLQLLDLEYCHNISEGICQVLRKCCKIRHLNLAHCSRVKLHRMNFVVPNLEVLNLSNTKVDYETLYVISKNCCGLSQLLLRNCEGVTEKAVKHVLGNCTQLRVVMEE
ncbi:F-box/LRR-repeat protein [Trifolium repens]|nr:F-box/LRR-repeat protein [Trifolium repens]